MADYDAGPSRARRCAPLANLRAGASCLPETCFGISEVIRRSLGPRERRLVRATPAAAPPGFSLESA